MRSLLWLVSLVGSLTICNGQGSSGQPGTRCVLCSSTTFLDVAYSDLVTIYEDHDCERGVGQIINCGLNTACVTIIGVETQHFKGYGNIDLHVVIRTCDDTANLGTMADECIPEDKHEDILADYGLGGGTTFVEFDGEICYCTNDTCNNVEAPPIMKPFRPHTPPPNTPGLQCRVCSHIQFHEDTLRDPLLENPGCEFGNLASEDVKFITCFEDSVCVNIRGQMTYTSFGFDFSADVFERRCHTPEALLSEETGCLDESVVPDNLEDYYSFIDDTSFTGAVCFCNSTLCDCDPQDCTQDTVSCEDFDFCTGENERCVDGLIGPRCECEEGYRKTDQLTCQPIVVSCITCSSRHFVSDVTSRTDLVDVACERGTGSSFSCLPGSVCATVVGTEVRYFDGYGNATINVVQRGCELRNLFDEDDQCLSDPRSADVLHFENEFFPRYGFTGEACYCEGDNCNAELNEIERVIRPDHPDPDTPGLQCIFCYYRIDSINGVETLDDTEYMNACLNGNLSHPDIFYDTCPPDNVCVNLQGNFTYFIGGAFQRSSVVERRCFPERYTSGEEEGCLVMDEIKDNLQMDYSSYYFYFDSIVVDAPACYCSSDVCDCDIDECLEEELTCNSGGDLCPNDNEYCQDTINGPECLCEVGYKRNREDQCQFIETCETKPCTGPNTECTDSNSGPICNCKRDYLLDAKLQKCISIFETCETMPCTEANTVCTDSLTGPVCTCKKGYVLNAKQQKCISAADDGDTNKPTGGCQGLQLLNQALACALLTITSMYAGMMY